MKISEFPSAVIKENVDYTVKEITNVIKRYGPRESGNENCFAAQKHIKKEMDTFSDETGFEEYKIAPKAFLHFTKTVSLLYIAVCIVSLILVYLNVFDGVTKNPFVIPHILVGFSAFFALFLTMLQIGLYKPVCDVFYKKKPAHNFYAVRKPRGEVKKRIIITGHVDAAYEWRHIYYSKKISLMFLFTGLEVAFAIYSLLVAVFSVVASYKDLGTLGNFMAESGYYYHAVGLVGMLLLLHFVDFKTVSPGANDNLTGTYAAVCAIRMLDMAGVELENTEVMALITDGEEAGLRGTKAWVKNHKDELKNENVETAVLVAETFGSMKDFHVYNKDLNGLLRHNKEFSEFVKEAGAEAGYKDMKYRSIFMGSSDGTAFTQGKIKCTAIAAMDPSPADYYHNRRDNYDRLDPETIEAGYRVMLSTILKFDEE